MTQVGAIQDRLDRPVDVLPGVGASTPRFHVGGATQRDA